jgi:hypothetical protein
MNARYRKYNDHSHNSSTYHKKDGTPVRVKLKKEAENEIEDSQKTNLDADQTGRKVSR